MKLRRARTIIPVLLCAVAIGGLLVGGLTRNAVPRSDATTLARRFSSSWAASHTGVATVAGAVVFDLTDGVETVRVHHRGDPPELFEDGAPVVSEGHWTGDEFSSDRLMIKHGSEYAPPAVDAGDTTSGYGAEAR